MWKVKVVHRVSAREIYDTFERFAVKIHRRVFVSCSRAKASQLLLFANWSEKPGAGNSNSSGTGSLRVKLRVYVKFSS